MPGPLGLDRPTASASPVFMDAQQAAGREGGNERAGESRFGLPPPSKLPPTPVQSPLGNRSQETVRAKSRQKGGSNKEERIVARGEMAQAGTNRAPGPRGNEKPRLRETREDICGHRSPGGLIRTLQ